MRKALEFTLTVNGRCLGCGYCPQATLGNAYSSDRKSLLYTDFEKVIEKLPKDVECHFSGFSECFLHPQAGLLMERAGKTHNVHLFTTLIGLSESQAEDVRRTKLQFVRVHVPDKVGLVFPLVAWRKRFELFLSTGHKFTAMTMGEMEPDMQSYLDGYGINVERPPMLSRAGNLVNVAHPHHKGRIECAMMRWHQNVMLPDGMVVGDCHDYGLTIRLGNLLEQPYSAIYAAAERWRISDHSHDICSKCEWATVGR